MGIWWVSRNMILFIFSTFHNTPIVSRMVYFRENPHRSKWMMMTGGTPMTQEPPAGQLRKHRWTRWTWGKSHRKWWNISMKNTGGSSHGKYAAEHPSWLINLSMISHGNRSTRWARIWWVFHQASFRLVMAVGLVGSYSMLQLSFAMEKSWSYGLSSTSMLQGA